MSTVLNPLEQAIVDYVTEKQGCKATELVASEEIVRNILAFPNLDVAATIACLVREKELVEVEYKLPGPFGTKSYLFPKGTEAFVVA